MLQLAQGLDAAPLAGRIAAALGTGARRLARVVDDAPDTGSGMDDGGESW